MTQPAIWGSFETGPKTQAEIGAQDNATFGGILSEHAGASRPAYVVAGTRWTKIVSASLWEAYWYDGTHDVLLFSINPSTGAIVAAGTAMVDLSNVATATRSESSNFTISPTDNNKTILVTAAATVTEAATIPTAGQRITFLNTGAKAGGYAVTLNLTIDGVLGRVLVGGESITLLALGSSAYRTIAEHNEPCAWSAYLSSAVSNATGDGTEYTIAYNAETFDIGSVHSSGTVTAIKSGVYSIGVHIGIGGILSTHTVGKVYIKTSNRNYYPCNDNPYATRNVTDNDRWYSGVVPAADIDAGDTVTTSILVANGTKVISIQDTNTKFQGHYVRSLT